MNQKKLKKYIGKTLSSSITVAEEPSQVLIKLKGNALVSELFENEVAYLDEIMKANKDVKVDVAENCSLGVYTIQWLHKLLQQINSTGGKMVVTGLDAKHNKLLTILGTRLSA